MKRAFWLITGVAIGLAAAKRISENPTAQAVVDDAAKRAKEFGEAVAEGFREREAEAKKPAARKPAAKKPAAKRPAARKPAAAKTTAK
jgi:hypothetical protein